ncbi:MAG: hypothetical protein ACE5JH_01115 [Acidobacteriota bacterium]
MPPAPPAGRRAPVALLALALHLPQAEVRAAPATDCFADRVASFRPGTVSAPPGFNTWQPGILLGPPGDGTLFSGSLTVMSLGRGGEVVLEFTDNEVVDGPGPDLILFENPFFCTAPPRDASDPFSVNAEPGIVAVSPDGIEFRTFPFDAAALDRVASLCTDDVLLGRLVGLMGLTPNIAGNYTIPDDPLVFDPDAPAGISGHGGDAFDLALVGLSSVRFVRITDPDLPIGIPGSADGIDPDAVVAIHSRPILPPGAADSDGDGLSDGAESLLYLTDPHNPDTDGDGTPDGVEAASCRNPAAAGVEPFFIPLLDLEVPRAVPTLLRWNSVGQGARYDVVRGTVLSLRSAGGVTDLGVVTCIEADSTDLTTSGFEDAGEPFPGEAFYYLVRSDRDGGGIGYGRSSALEPRVPASGDCP